MKASTERKTMAMLDVIQNLEIRWNRHRLVFLIIPILSCVCMFLSGCDATDEQALQSRVTRSVADPDQSPPSGNTITSSSHSQIPRQASEERLRIVALGDSLTAGLGVPPEESYPSRLQRRLDEAGYHYRVINAGVTGDTTAGALRRLNWVLKSQPNIVIIELGANDGLRGQPVNNTYENLRQIIQRLKDAGVHVLLTGMKIPPNYGLDYTSQFAGMYSRLADEFSVTFMPFFLEDVAAHRALNQVDGIHPTGEGYRIIVDNLLPVLEPLLKANSRATSGIIKSFPTFVEAWADKPATLPSLAVREPLLVFRISSFVSRIS